MFTNQNLIPMLFAQEPVTEVTNPETTEKPMFGFLRTMFTGQKKPDKPENRRLQIGGIRGDDDVLHVKYLTVREGIKVTIPSVIEILPDHEIAPWHLKPSVEVELAKLKQGFYHFERREVFSIMYTAQKKQDRLWRSLIPGENYILFRCTDEDGKIVFFRFFRDGFGELHLCVHTADQFPCIFSESFVASKKNIFHGYH